MERDDKTLAAHLMTTVGPLRETIQSDPRATIRPRAEGVETAGSRARRAIEGLVGAAGAAGHAGVDLADTLGEGGMGIVRLGTQRSMGRQVAVKTARVDKRGEAATIKLLREAWVTGALEHPNVLPVYDVGLDTDGAPVIVMRLVDGTEWSRLMHDGAAVAKRFGAEELLEWNLRIFMQVCNAIRFAHSRKIIHRDLKPENIMVGQFGEVYVLDWGIAVSLEDDGTGRFPLASEADQTVGTPAYMAPEMLDADAATLSEKTDVYLLGAILYEIVEGDPPHRCDSLEMFVESVASSKPRFRRPVSEELEGIVRKAMACDAADRFEDVEALRLAVQAFLRHRGSARLAREASERLLALRDAIEGGPGGDLDGHRMRVHNLFAECRFGFQEALAQWPENKEAKRGRREAVVAVAGFELEHGEHHAAALLLSEIEDPPPELLARIEQAQAVSEAEREELEKLRRMGRDLDTRIGQRTRWFLLSVLGVIWTILPLVLAGRPPPADHWGIFWFPVVFLVVGGVFAIWARDSLMKTAFNRRASAAVALALVAQAVLALGTMVAGIPVPSVLPLEFFLWFCVSAMMTIVMEWRLWPSAVGYLAAFFGVAWAHAHAGEHYVRTGLYIMAAAHACLTLTVLVIWKPRSVFRRLPGEEEVGSG